jgi:hypothetical protein
MKMDLFDFDYSAIEMEKEADKVRIPTIGDQVEIVSIGATGSIMHIDYNNLYDHHFFPIQVDLDNPYECQNIYRTSLKDVIILC